MNDVAEGPVDADRSRALRWRAVIALALASALLAIVLIVTRYDSTPVFCTGEGMIGQNGQLYGRSSKHDCKFIDEHGDVLTTDAQGNPFQVDEP